MLQNDNKWLPRILLGSVVVIVMVMLLLLPKGKDGLPTLTPESPYPYLVYYCKEQGDNVVVEGIKPQDTVAEALPDKQLLRKAVKHLLAGPTEAETGKGYYSEIPAGTKLLSIKGGVENAPFRVNLSEAFREGGGSTTMRLRLEQMTKTVLSTRIEGPVYLDVEGEPLDVLGGEGVEVDKPLNQGKDAA
ncbi:MAG: GerMN domain-containing protein [Cyanobacteria bacterium HKST-UBA04]|nr:GerMN domain-containing protein [Cyanobacteria bacterium HKST-UBA04]